MTETRLADNYKTKVGPIEPHRRPSIPWLPHLLLTHTPCSTVMVLLTFKSNFHWREQDCWTTFQVKCIRSWASKSVKDIADAWRARGEEWNGDWRCQAVNLDEKRCQQAIGTYIFIFHAFHKTNQIVQGVSAARCQSPSLVNSLHPIHAVVRARVRERECVSTPARYNATLDLVPHVKSPCGWNATVHARRSFHSVVGPMGRESAK